MAPRLSGLSVWVHVLCEWIGEVSSSTFFGDNDPLLIGLDSRLLLPRSDWLLQPPCQPPVGVGDRSLSDSELRLIEATWLRCLDCAWLADRKVWKVGMV
jgi:hypothetical protein